MSFMASNSQSFQRNLYGGEKQEIYKVTAKFVGLLFPIFIVSVMTNFIPISGEVLVAYLVRSDWPNNLLSEYSGKDVNS